MLSRARPVKMERLDAQAHGLQCHYTRFQALATGMCDCAPNCGQAIGAVAVARRSCGESRESQCLATNLKPVTSLASFEHSHSAGLAS